MTTAISGGSLARTGEYHTRGIHTTPHLHWTFTPSSAISCPVVVEQGIVYLGSNDGLFSAIEATSGALLWQRALSPSSGISSFCLADELVYLTTAEGGVMALDLHTQESVWSARIAEHELMCSSQWRLLRSASLTASGTRLLFAADRFHVVLDRFTGVPLFTGDAGFAEPPTISPRHVHALVTLSQYDIVGETQLCTYDLHTGQEIWRSTYYGNEEKRVPVKLYSTRGFLPLVDQTLFVMGDEPQAGLLALEPASGRLLWSCYADTMAFSAFDTLLAAAYGLVYVLCVDGGLHAIDLGTHHLRWTTALGTGERGAGEVARSFLAMILVDRLLYALRIDGAMCALDALTGQQRWEYQLELDTSWEARDASRDLWWLCHAGFPAHGLLCVTTEQTLYALGE